MMSGCCNNSCSLDPLRKRQRGTLQIVPGINAVMFFVIAAAFCCGAQERQLKEQSPQVDLLDTSEYDYDYFCYVTTESFTPWQTHKKYGERATCETWIEESKGPMGMGKIRTAEFLVNAALFHCAVLAYNTLRWMAIMSDSQPLRQWEPETIRTVWFV